MTRLLLIACLLSVLATAGMAFTLTRSEGASAQEPQQLVLRVGDSLRVEGARMGCRVTRRGGRPFIECLRNGNPAGTYGTFMSDRSLRVARFRSRRTAQTILTARHGGEWRVCRQAVRTSRLAFLSRGCRPSG